jgi:hypothetical protein
MAPLIDQLDKYIFSGVPSNAAWDLIKIAWEKANQRGWEDLYLDAFGAALADARPHLVKYADGEISLDRETLYRVLHQDLGAAVSAMPLSALTDEQFTRVLAGALADRQALLIGGHNLSQDDYAQLVGNLVRQAAVIFRTSMTQNTAAFQQAMLGEALANQALVRDAQAYLADKFGLILGELEDIGRKLDFVVEATSPAKSLLTIEEFAARAECSALVSHPEVIVGREQLLDEISAQLAGLFRIIILHGPGGAGKTRLLLALPGIVPEGVQLWYARTGAESIERDLAALDQNQQHVIVIDDAHRFDPLPQLCEVLVNPDFAGKVKIVLSTRSVFSASVGFYFSQIPGDQITEVEVGFLTNADIDYLLQNPPWNIDDQGVRQALIVVAEGNPLIAQIGAGLVQRGTKVTGLTRDQVLTRYFDDLIHDLAEAGYDEHYVAYLEVLAGLGTLDLSNEILRQRVQQVIGISQVEEERIVARLEGASLIERYWKTIKIASEVLADHILFSHFFDPRTRRADYQKQIIEPFLNLKPKQILTNLAEAEVKGESLEAGLLLGHKLDELYRLVDSGSNSTRLLVLDWLEKVAYLRPDETLFIVSRIVDGPEQPPETYQDRWWSSYNLTHEMVLNKAVDIVSRTIYRGAWHNVVAYLHKLARYRPEAAEYERVREKARNALVDIAEFKRRKPYAVQLTLLQLIPDWLAWDFTGSLDLVFALVKPMLSMQLHGAEPDPTKPYTVVVQHGVLNPSESLRQIRERTLEILYDAYRQATTISQRLRIVQILEGAAPHFLPDMPVPDETRAWLQPDCANTTHFFFETVVPTAELPALDAVSRWLWRASRWGSCQAEELDRLRAQLQTHNLYQLYRVLVGSYRWDEADERLDLHKSGQRRREAIDDFLEGLSEETLGQTIHDLDTIVGQARDANKALSAWFNYLLVNLGERYPDLARRVVDRSLASGLALKHQLGAIIAGLRRSAHGVAATYIEAWVVGDDPVLWLEIARSYRLVNWSQLQAQEWDILRQLVTYDSLSVDREILWLIPQFTSYNPDLTRDILMDLAVRGGEEILHIVAEVLSWSDPSQEGYVVEFVDPQDYLDIVQNFERLPSLDFHVERCLDRLGKIEPMQVIDLIERRITAVQEGWAESSRYDAVPFQFSRATDSIRSSPQYLDVLRRVRDWMLRDGSWFLIETPRVLKEISGGLGASLYGVLMEWVKSGDTQKLYAVAGILQEFNSGQSFYDLCREIICRADDEAVLRSIAAAIGSTPSVIGGPMSNFSKRRSEEISPWLEDDDLRVRSFGRRMQQSLQERIEREQAEEEFERRNW